MVDSKETKYWIGFSLIPGIGRVKFSLLKDYFGDVERAWLAPTEELKAAGLDTRSAKALVTVREEISLEDELAKLSQQKVRAITENNPEYPSRLKETHDYPPLLYVRGELAQKDEWSIAVVGTRRASIYGKQVTEEIVADLAGNGITIISGLARGIDSIAHRTALEAGGRTIAVTGCGLDTVYPGEHVNLAHKIAGQGALVSEYPLGTKPRAEHFPLRNRIMSGMSLGVLVIEAGERSGATITAHRAVEQNREVFAVPGSIYSPTSKGSNNLIQEGAKLVRNCADILEELNFTMLPRQMEIKEAIPANAIESQLLGCLSKEAIHIDDLCRQSGLPIAQVSSTLAMLELRGLAKQLGGMNYILA